MALDDRLSRRQLLQLAIGGALMGLNSDVFAQGEARESVDRKAIVSRFFEEYDRFRKIVSSCPRADALGESVVDRPRLQELDSKLTSLESHLSSLKPFFGDPTKNVADLYMPEPRDAGERNGYRIYDIRLFLPFSDLEKQMPSGIFNLNADRRPLVTLRLLRQALESAQEIPDAARDDMDSLPLQPYVSVPGGALSEYLARMDLLLSKAAEIHVLFEMIETKGSPSYLASLQRYTKVMSGEEFESQCFS